MHKWLIVICILGFPFVLQAQGANTDWIQRGLEQQKRGELDAAIYSFSQYLTEHPQNYPKAYYYRGYLYFHQKKYAAAISDFQYFFDLEPQSVEGVYALGKSYYQQTDWPKAIDCYTQAIQLDPHYSRAYNDRGLVLCQMRQFDMALEDFYKATSLDTSFAMAYNNSGVARYFNQDIAKPTRKDLLIASEWFGRAIEQDPTLALAYRNRAAMHIFLKKYPAALQDLTRAEQLEPEDAMIFFYFGVVYADQQQSEKALKAFERALELNPQLAFAHEEMGNLFKHQQQFGSAIRQYQLAQQSRRSLGKLYRGLLDYRIALVYAEQEQKQAMYAALKRARKAKTFGDMRVYRDFLKAKELHPFRKEKSFKRFTKSVRKGEKDNKFLHPDLSWFRMRKE